MNLFCFTVHVVEIFCAGKHAGAFSPWQHREIEEEKMNIALILAGGTDPSFQMNVPKQFVNVFNRPVIVYTLELFQKHKDIDAIAVACLEGWQEMVRVYGKQFGIDKLRWIFPGGITGQESSQKGTEFLKNHCKQDDIIIIHDAIRPMVPSDVISDSIEKCRIHGMGVAAVRTMDTIMKTSDGKTGQESIERTSVVRIQTPQAYRMDKLMYIHKRAGELGIRFQVDTNSVASRIGEMIYFSKGSDLNMKINSIEDVERFKAVYMMGRDG